MRVALWPDQTETDMSDWLRRPDALVVVAERPRGGLRGFAESGLRSYAEGCRSRPVAYLEGWYVDLDRRRQGVSRALVAAVEAWAREAGCTELASDTERANLTSQQAHERLGYEEVERAVMCRIAL